MSEATTRAREGKCAEKGPVMRVEKAGGREQAGTRRRAERRDVVALALYTLDPYGSIPPNGMWNSSGSYTVSFTATTAQTRIKFYRYYTNGNGTYFLDNVKVQGAMALAKDSYRFGFNGKEKDDEVYGASGTSYDYGFRIYDPRVARFLSTDPLFKSYPFYTPYQFAGNNPVAFIDLDGLERAVPKKHDGRTALEIYTEKHGKVDIYNPTSRYGEKRKRGDPTGWGFGQEFPSLVGEPTNRTYEAGQSSQENPLTRQSWQGEDRTLEGRVQLIPEHNDGRLTLSFEPGTDEKGKPVNGTFELGVIDAEGKEHSLASTTSNKPGSISIDFRLKEGESLYQRSTDLGAGGSLRTSATIAPDDKNEK